jgi:hypothetical protein
MVSQSAEVALRGRKNEGRETREGLHTLHPLRFCKEGSLGPDPPRYISAFFLEKTAR